METAENIANKFTMKRFRTAGYIDGHDDKEFFDLLTDDIKTYALHECEKVRRDCADACEVGETNAINYQFKEAVLSTPITLE